MHHATRQVLHHRWEVRGAKDRWCGARNFDGHCEHPTALAWGDEGHLIVAAVAYGRMKPALRAKVDAILNSDKSDSLTKPDFVSRATWADKYRDSDRDRTQERYKATRNWHFVDLDLDTPDLDSACNHHPGVPDGEAASKGTAEDCVVDKIDQFVAELGKPETGDAERALALKFLIHFVGDVHQPLHTAERHHDSGGNLVRVLYGQNKESNLHSYWDTFLVSQLGSNAASIAASLRKNIKPADAKAWSVGSPTEWAQESHAMAKTKAYALAGLKQGKTHEGSPAYRMTSAYDSAAVPMVRRQLSKAGVRLAELIARAIPTD